MESQFPEAMLERIRSAGVIAVLIIDDADHAVPLARALLAGGVDAIELTLRTPAALEALRAIREAVPEVLAGIGTVLTPGQVDEIVDAGASFGVSPGVNRRVIERAQDRGLPFAPGIVTPSDIEAALELGCRDLKFFPAEPSGGLKMLASIKAPYAHLGVRYIPLGGLNTRNMASYLSDPDVVALGGSWLAKPAVIRQADWETITATAREARRIADTARSTSTQGA